ncbi:hypothetical protein PsorP6_005656 [Peronosclerospora sorghi]|uniref:Uncharacterized protein n=1 Tax=Peronosclerospora sorghi TaxID=230839 RepID=A0ACC0W7W6_9STRA|nr:hypothetical protein PsorP6_005656 [Peronosclerospora sorghi]
MAHRELLRASARDADAVRQYLASIEADELDELLDSLTPRCSNKRQKKSAVLVPDDWLPLVRLLLQCEATRLRTASYIIQVLRRGSPSELESMQLLTEVSIGYSSGLDALQELQATEKMRLVMEKKKLLDEMHVVLEIIFSFLEEIISDEMRSSTTKDKVLPQLLGLVPFFLGLREEISGKATSECLAKLLELPWSCRTVPSLLNALMDDMSLMSRESWQQLQKTIERMVTTSPEMASESMNPLIRECVLVANLMGGHEWIGIARYLLRQLPVRCRQEAEFNLQMSLNQSPRIVSLVCESIRCSQAPEQADVVIIDLTDDPLWGAVDLQLDWSDLFLLLHSLQVSKPILQHRTSSSRVATDASVFSEIEELAWLIIEGDAKAFISSMTRAATQRPNKSIEKHVQDQVEFVLNFGGKQVHARQWKALLLMDVAFFWIEHCDPVPDDEKLFNTSKSTLALMLLQAIFETAPETRAEVLSSLFERSQKPAQRKVCQQAFTTTKKENGPDGLVCLQYRLQAKRCQNYSFLNRQRCFRISMLFKIGSDLYNFMMVFLRKLFSTGNQLHQKFAVDMWCTWLEQRLPFNEQQEEEIVSTIKNSVAATRDIQAWSFGRLEQLFQYNKVREEGPVITLRKCSWEELHRFFSQEIGKFIVPTTSDNMYEDDQDCGYEYDDHESVLSRFHFSSLNALYQQNASLDGAASTGLVFQKLLSCLIRFGQCASVSKTSSEGLPLEGLSATDSEIKQWLIDLISNWKYFFHWICQDLEELLSQSVRDRACTERAWWKLVARIFIGCAVCNIAIEILMSRGRNRSSGEQNSLNEEMAVFGGFENCELSIWSLMEVEFSLHRMIQKLSSQYATEMETRLSKELVRSASHGLFRVLQPAKLNLLTTIKRTFENTATSKRVDSERPNGMSFETILFVLDSCSSSVDDVELSGTSHRVENDPRESSFTLELLLSVYVNLRSYILPASEASGFQNSERESNKGNTSVSSVQLSLYADSIAAKFPAAARPLVDHGKGAKAVVLLDSKRAEEVLEHICAAIGRTLNLLIKSSNLQSAHDQVGHSLLQVSWTEDCEAEGTEYKNQFARLSCIFLRDVKESAQLDGLTKFCVSCALLSKRLLEYAAKMVNTATALELGRLSSLAYEILCDNVVYNARLLRLLLSICLPTHLALSMKTFVTLERKIQGIIQTCRNDFNDDTDRYRPRRDVSRSHRRPGKKKKAKKNVAAHRKRLRQGFDTSSSDDWSPNSDSDFDSSYSSGTDVSDEHQSIFDKGNGYTRSPGNRERVPNLQSHATQNIALLAVLALLEHSQSTLLRIVAVNSNDRELNTFPHYQEIQSYLRIHELVIHAISNNFDSAWNTRRVLLKVLHMMELGLRIGKATGALQRKGDDAAIVQWHDSIICIYEAAVTSAVKSRAWVSCMKEASHDFGTKCKVHWLWIIFALCA